MKRLFWGALATIVIAITPLFLGPKTITIVAASSSDPWAGYALLKHIASCESWGDPNKDPREFLPNGTVLRGSPNPQDIGLAQINLPTWGAKAKELGYDLFTYDGNLAMAKWIFTNDPRHEQNWSWSRGCWGKYDVQTPNTHG